ncbi:MAG: PQQ-dependent sugar dehydrogenase [Enterococcus sp.]
MKRLVLLSAVLFIGSSCASESENMSTEDSSGELTQTTEVTDSSSSRGEDEDVLAENLQVPWSIEKHGSTFYITERAGTIAKVEDETVTRQSIVLDKELSSASEAGLLGFVLSKNFEDSAMAYIYYTYEDEGEQYNRIAQVVLENNQWNEERILVDAIPSGTVHHGGRLKIGPDEKLYATTGDAQEPDNAQKKDNLAGKILRINLDGHVPEDNPIADSFIYSYGHRNPQGLAWSEVGQLYASEHGSSANDEINQIEAGKNYGWPIIQGEASNSDMETPLVTSGSETTWAPSGMAYHEDKLYVGTLRGTALLQVDLKDKSITELVTTEGRIRDVMIEGNSLYYITNNTDGRGTPRQQDDRLVKINLTE